MPDDQVELALGSAASDRPLHSDPHDFAGLYIRHRSSFTLHARRYLRDARDADEVVQEAFLRLFLALPELETELQALAYCRRTITNLCIDRYRAQARRPHLVDLDSVPADDLAEDDPGDPVVRAEDAAVVREALSLLSPLHRAALVKREIEEKPLPVIAAELDIPEESVKHVLFRARRALRRVLASTSVAPEVVARAARKSGTGLAALAMLLVAGLSTGPDLQAIPVVGKDLPDLPGIVEIAQGLIDVLTPASGGDGSGSEGSGSTSSGEGGGPAAVDVSPSPTADSPALAVATGTVDIVTTSPIPTTVPSPVSTRVPSTVPTVEPTLEPRTTSAPRATAEPTREPTREPSREPSAPTTSRPPLEPVAEPEEAGSPTPSRPAKSPKASPSPTQTVDPDSYQTDGIEWVEDPETGELVLVPLGQTSRYSG